MAALWDLFPSFQELAGMKASKTTDGISLLPLLKEKKQKQHDYLYWEFHESGGRQALRWKNWKIVKLNVSTGKPEPTELYDITKDPAEINNLAAQYPGIVQKMEKWMKTAHVPNRNWPLFPGEK
jgi:arylsulfatase A